MRPTTQRRGNSTKPLAVLHRLTISTVHWPNSARAAFNLSLAVSAKLRLVLAEYRRRWTIEAPFGNLKTKGFNLEGTHLADPTKFLTLLVVLAMALSFRTGVAAFRIKLIAITSRRRMAAPLFAFGLVVWRKLFLLPPYS